MNKNLYSGSCFVVVVVIYVYQYIYFLFLQHLYMTVCLFYLAGD